jgi:hypothetical protein
MRVQYWRGVAFKLMDGGAIRLRTGSTRFKAVNDERGKGRAACGATCTGRVVHGPLVGDLTNLHPSTLYVGEVTPSTWTYPVVESSIERYLTDAICRSDVPELTNNAFSVST